MVYDRNGLSINALYKYTCETEQLGLPSVSFVGQGVYSLLKMNSWITLSLIIFGTAIFVPNVGMYISGGIFYIIHLDFY